MTALSRSRVFVPLLSAGSLDNMCKIGEKTIDNVRVHCTTLYHHIRSFWRAVSNLIIPEQVLLEWAAAIELHSRSVPGKLHVVKIVPLFLGQGWWLALSDRGPQLQAHAIALEEKLRSFLVEITGDGSIDGLFRAISQHDDVPKGQLTALGVIRAICSYQGKAAHTPEGEQMDSGRKSTELVAIVKRSIAALDVHQRAYTANRSVAAAALAEPVSPRMNGSSGDVQPSPQQLPPLVPGRRLETVVVDALRDRISQLTNENTALKTGHSGRMRQLTDKHHKALGIELPLSSCGADNRRLSSTKPQAETRLHVPAGSQYYDLGQRSFSGGMPRTQTAPTTMHGSRDLEMEGFELGSQ